MTVCSTTSTCTHSSLTSSRRYIFMVYIKFKFVNDFFIKFLSAVLSGTFGWELQFSENLSIQLA
uniref:Candidate secreted effector n=1 Tax=Meloidogyne incognita TaxID=6306 RepID=A0A914MFV5_MELIC